MPVDLDERGRALENDYFRRKEQELIEKMRTKLASQDAKTLELSCPKCDGTLMETDYESIKIDVCNKCSGAWFDAGELAQVVDKEAEGGWFGGMFK